MKAIIITKPGAPSVIQLMDVSEPRPSAEQILVKVHAAGVNRADLLQRKGHYAPPAGVRDDIPGLEFAGVVEAVGEKVTSFKSGERVMGLLAGGGYAEKITCHEKMAMPIPNNLSFEQAAAIPEVFMTAYDALFVQLGLNLDERLLIHAIGSGVGTAALQLAKTVRATVFGTAGSEEKLAKAKELGLDIGIHYKTQDFRDVVAGETNGEGVHAILDTIGAAYWEKNLASLAIKGRMILVGLLGGRMVEANLGSILTKRLRIIGTALRSRPLEEKINLTRSFMKQVLPLLESGKVKPVIDRTFPLADAAEAHVYMETNKNFGKIILQVA